MQQLVLNLSDSQAARLTNIAGKIGVKPEALAAGVTFAHFDSYDAAGEFLETVGDALTYAATGKADRKRLPGEGTIETGLRRSAAKTAKDLAERLTIDGDDPALAQTVLATAAKPDANGRTRLVLDLDRDEIHAIASVLEGCIDSNTITKTRSRSLAGLREIVESACAIEDEQGGDEPAFQVLKCIPFYRELLRHAENEGLERGRIWIAANAEELQQARERARLAVAE